MPETTLSADNGVDIAKSVLWKMPCKWGECKFVLNSWNMVKEHHHYHCHRSQNREGKWICKLPGCAGRIHASREALESHIDLSHMSRLTLPCPIQGCEQSGIRVAQLPIHIHTSHSGLLGSTVTDNSNLIVFKSGYTPFRPHLEKPPPLPYGERTLIEIDPLSIRGGPPKRKRAHSSSQSFGRKWSRLDAQDEEEGEPEAAELDDLLAFDRSKEGKKRMYKVKCRRKPPESAASVLSQAHRIVDPPPPDEEPPTSIHFDAFARKVDELVAKGQIQSCPFLGPAAEKYR